MQFVSRSHPILLVVFLLASLAAVPAANAGEVGDNIFLNGFVGQGYLNTSENTYLVERSVNGTSAFTEAAITLITQPMDRLRVGIQFLGRSFGTSGRDQVMVDWAYGDYRWKDQLGFRAGKVKLPYGLYNEGRDVDMLRTPIFLPQSIYNERMRDFILAYEGAGAYGSFDLDSLGELDYHVYGGTLNIPTATEGFWADLFATVGQELEPIVGLVFDQANGYSPGTSEADFRTMDASRVTFPWIYGGALIWTTPLEGFRVGWTGLQGRYNIKSILRYDVNVPAGNPEPGYHPFALDIDETVKMNHLTTVSGEYLRDNWNLAAEYYWDHIADTRTKGWYVLAGYQVSRPAALSVYYSDADPLGGDQDIQAFAESGLPDYYGWQRDLAVSTRFDLTDFWLLKFEYHFIDGVGMTEPRLESEDLANPKARRWGMLAVKTTFHF